MKYLITGGAGYLGSVLSLQLAAGGHSVRVLDDLSGAPRGGAFLQSMGVDVIVGSVVDRELTRRASDGVDCIIHLAALVGAPKCARAPDLAEKINVRGTVSVIDARQPGQGLILASTGSVYGRLEGLCEETSECNPLSAYARTKLEAEELVFEAGGVCLRFATLMGPSPAMRFDLLVNHVVWTMVHEGEFKVFEGDALRTFLDVRDAARAIRFFADTLETLPWQVFNVGSETGNLTKGEVVRRVAERVGGTLTQLEGYSDPDARDYFVDYSRLSSLGFVTSYSLGLTLGDVAAMAALCPTADWLHL